MLGIFTVLHFSTEIANITQWNKEYPLSRYAAQHWYKHAKIVNSDKIYQEAYKHIQPHGAAYKNCLKLAEFEEDSERDWTLPQPLYYAAWCGLQNMVNHW